MQWVKRVHPEIPGKIEEDKPLTKEIAGELIKKFVGDKPYGFIQTNTGAGNREIPDGFGENWLRKNRNLEYFIEIGKTYNHLDYNINIQFEFLRRASGVCLPNSVFYHACTGLNKNVDFAYFPREVDYKRGGNLNKNITENLFHIIPKL